MIVPPRLSLDPYKAHVELNRCENGNHLDSKTYECAKCHMVRYCSDLCAWIDKPAHYPLCKSVRLVNRLQVQLEKVVLFAEQFYQLVVDVEGQLAQGFTSPQEISRLAIQALILESALLKLRDAQLRTLLKLAPLLNRL